MTVGELIEELEKMDESMPVFADTGDGFFDVEEVTSDDQGDAHCFLLLGSAVDVDE